MKNYKHKLTLKSSIARTDSSSTRTSSCFLEQKSINQTQMPAIEEIDSRRNSLSYISEGEEALMNGRYVICIRDSDHLNDLQMLESNLLHSFLMQHITIIYQDDLHLHGLNDYLPIHLDYFTQRITDFSSQEILSFRYLQQMRKSLNKYQTTESTNKIKRNRSMDLPIRTRQRSNRGMTVLNIDHDQDRSDSTMSEAPLREVHHSIANGYQEIETDKVTFKECCVKNPLCVHKSNIETIDVKSLITLAFSTDNGYYFAVLVCAYEKLFASHTQFLQEIIKLYYSKKDEYDYLVQILRLMMMWLDIRSQDIQDDNTNFFTVISCFIEIALLLNYAKSLSVEQSINHLSQQIKQMKETRNKNIEEQLAIRKITKKRLSFDDASPPLPKLHKRKYQSYDQTKFMSMNLKVDTNFQDWKFYIDIPLIVLQRQFFIIDYELIQRISISSIVANNNTQMALKEVADHFDYLLFHMIASTISCPQKPLLFQKFIGLYQLARESMHYQLAYLLYTYFTHDLVQIELNVQEDLNRLHQQIYRQIHYDHQQLLLEMTFNQQSACIPCTNQLQLQIFKYNQHNHLDTVHFRNLELLAHQLFQIAFMQFQAKHLQINIYKQEPYYTEIASTFKSSLKKYLQCEKRQMEIKLYQISKSFKQQNS